ncbi:hypothetical protein K2X14_07470 [Acetobacter sp. TBRC 12305]|uniref:Uncharacterized protein n=1 Tax=Acetobacter garciniae TaxID=2817435 RepID=A0A939HPJ9_9PROT|nr:hypothetical protein [Acetobacter garciniae]MBO1324979.1 hypothetical protein [Acetobacter garciniae]MBX0344670.1 hypothetical protein [Acetobacter garciniae]
MTSKLKLFILYFLFSAIAGLSCFVFGNHMYIDSDEANYALAVQDMAQGNFFLKKWIFSPDNFWVIDLMGMHVLTTLLGSTPVIPHVMAALWWGGVTFLCLILCNMSCKEPSWKRCLPVIVFIALMPLYDHGPENFITYIPYHVGTVFYGLCIFVAIQALLDGRNNILPLLMVFLCATLISTSDFFGVVTAIIPAFAALIFNMKSDRVRRSVSQITVALLCGFIMSKILHGLVARNGGFHALDIHPRFVAFDALPTRIIYTIQSVLDFFGVDFFGKRLGSSLICMLRAIPFVGMVYGVFLLVRKVTPSTFNRYDYLSQAFFIGFCIDFLAAFLSDFYLEKEDIIRYFLPSFLYFVLFFARTCRITPAMFYVPILVTLVIYPFAWRNMSRQKADPFHVGHQLNASPLIHVLNDNNLHRGYAGYWEGSLVTYQSGGKIVSRAIYDEHASDRQKKCNLYPYQWLSRLDWYAKQNIADEKYLFFITHNSVPNDNKEMLRRRDVFNTFGTPVKSLSVGDNTNIDIYEESTVEACSSLFITYLFDRDDPPRAIGQR